MGIKTSFSIAEVSVLLDIEPAGEVGQFTEKRKDVDCVNNNIEKTILTEIDRKGMQNLAWVFAKRVSKCGKSRIKPTYEAKKLFTID